MIHIRICRGVMSVDVSYKNITELRFDAVNSLPEEAEAAAEITKLSASHNSIHRIDGLGALFSRLTCLDLSHNRLGCGGTENASGICTTPWLSALPRSLHVLNLSHNHLRGFSLGDDISHGGGATNSPGCEAALGRMRLACPLAVSLFFNRRRFPHLRELDLSSNELHHNLEDGDFVEAAWREVLEVPAASACSMKEGQTRALESTCAIAVFRVDDNEGLLCLNGMLCGMEYLVSLHATGCGIADLKGVSSAVISCPKLRVIDLRNTPIVATLLSAPQEVVAALAEVLLFPVLLASRVGIVGEKFLHGDKEGRHGALRRLMKKIAQHHLHEMEAFIEEQHSSMHGNHSAVKGGLRMLLYVSLMHQLLPQITVVDCGIEVAKSLRALGEAARHVVKNVIVGEYGPSHGTGDVLENCVSPPKTSSPVRVVDGGMLTSVTPTTRERFSTLSPITQSNGDFLRQRTGCPRQCSPLCSPKEVEGASDGVFSSKRSPLSPTNSPLVKERNSLAPLPRSSCAVGAKPKNDSRPLLSTMGMAPSPFLSDAPSSSKPTLMAKYGTAVGYGRNGTEGVMDKEESSDMVGNKGTRDRLMSPTGADNKEQGRSMGVKDALHIKKRQSARCSGYSHVSHYPNECHLTCVVGPPAADSREVGNGRNCGLNTLDNRQRKGLAPSAPEVESTVHSTIVSESHLTMSDRSGKSIDLYGGHSGGSGCYEYGNNDSTTSSTCDLTNESTSRIKELLQQARSLEQALVSSQSRQRSLKDTIEQLKSQLHQDRQLITDQRQEAVKLRMERDNLVNAMKNVRRRLKKRQKDVVYGATALKRREALEQQRAMLHEFEKERKKLQEQERVLRKTASLCGLFSHGKGVDGLPREASQGPNGKSEPQQHLRKARADVLRENAVRQRMEATKKVEPLSYTPRRYRRSDYEVVNECGDALVNRTVEGDPPGEAEGKDEGLNSCTNNLKCNVSSSGNVNSVNHRMHTAAAVGNDTSPEQWKGNETLVSLYEQGFDPYFIEDNVDFEGEGGDVVEFSDEKVQEMSLHLLFDAAVDVQRRRLLMKQLVQNRLLNRGEADGEEESIKVSLIDHDIAGVVVGTPPRHEYGLSCAGRNLSTKEDKAPTGHNAAVGVLHATSRDTINFSGESEDDLHTGGCSAVQVVVPKEGFDGICEAALGSVLLSDGNSGEEALLYHNFSHVAPEEELKDIASSESSDGAAQLAVKCLSGDARNIYAEILRQKQ
uniref:Uncharacterized protein TCIL3000_10_12270 n=1 Tax=Trypanosoma congolense (strain IL3000) TaxID=1068625 RepID=G0UYH8_TRYCI|nr:unnamed protein product [Trypanosoma congolense IL3000]